ncbi:MAG TPA: DUF420 domain-containing protein [Blastocatellia bacterium]|nr:DUF420 domain-containing protein [Blastocatellia bacterium]
MNGFLGTGATFRADLNLVVQVAMGVMLLIGMALARKKNFRAHKYCQSSVMALNLVMILLIMAPSFEKQVQQQIPGGLKDAFYLVPYVHALLGTLAEVLGLYIVLVAATKLIPKKLRFKRYKPWMRAELALWWIVLLIGGATYYLWYMPPSSTKAAQPAPALVTQTEPMRVIVKISNFKFEPQEVTVTAGTTVEWIDETGRHTVEADDGSFKSDTMTAGGRFEHRFDMPGDYAYYCAYHGDKHGKDMAGTVTVTPAK